MGTNYIAPIWRMPENTNKDKLSNYSIDFNGSSDKIEAQDASNEFGFSNNSFSLSAWVFIDSVSTQNGIIAKRNIGGNASNKMWYFEINTSSQLRFLWYTSSSSSNTSSTDTIPLNTWTHVVITNNGAGANGLTFYINGTEDSGGSKTGPSSASSIQQTGTPLWVGARGGNTTAQYTNGKIGQVTVFDYALSIDQITYLYNLNNPMVISGGGPIAYYPLGDNSNPTANAGYPNISVGADSVFKFNSDRIDLGLESSLGLGGASKYSTSLWFKKSSNSTSCLWGYNYGDANGSGWYYWLNSGNLRIATGKNGISSGFGYYEISANELPVGE